MEINSLEDLFIEQLYDMYYAENKLTKALPKMAKKANDAKLKKAFETHLEETKDQIVKIENIMRSLDIKIKGEKCEAIEGLLKEADELMSNIKEPEALDAGLILAAQKIEHYEIATYGCLCAFANRLGYKAVGKILHSILEQERKTDSALTNLAEISPCLNELAKVA